MTSTDEDQPPVKLWEHVNVVFAAMQKQAKSEQVNGKHALVFTGHTTRLFRELQLATPLYSSVLQRLKQMGCIRQLSRGGGSAASRWELITDPDLEIFERVQSQNRQSSQPTVASLAQRLEKVEKLLDLRETGT